MRTALRVEARRRLVQEDDPGLVDDAECDVDAPALTSGVRLALAVGVLGQLERLQRGRSPTLRLGLADAVHPRVQHQLFASGRVVPRAAALRDVTDAFAHLARVLAQIHARNRRLTAVGLEEGG